MATVSSSLLDPFAALNDAQRAAVEHGHDPLLVIAGAGTGKTLTLAARVARLVGRGADPARILLLTFSRRAAQEMAHRAGRLLHQALGLRPTLAPPSLPWAGTFHSVGARLLRDIAPRIGLSESFSIHDRGDAEDLMGIVRQRLDLGDTHKRFPLKGTCLAIYSRAVNSQSPLGVVLRQSFPWCLDWAPELGALFGAYVDEKQQQHALDYDDLLLYWAQAMQDASIARDIAARFDHVLVDEYQDTNRLQAAVLRALKPDGQGLTVVGDDAQAIYSFRAAEQRNILDFPAQFGARVLSLTRNYRSTQPLLQASNAVIALASERFAKELWSDTASDERARIVSVADESAQARWVADQALLQREAGLALKRQAVLFRSGAHSAALELELTRRNIPFVKYGGLRFLEAAHIKDVLAVLRWAQNPRSRLAGFRAARLVQGLSPARAQRLLDTMAQADDPASALLGFRPPPNAARAWSEFALLYAALRAGGSAWPQELAHVHAWYLPQLRRLHEHATVREADLAQLEHMAAGHASRERFLTELTLDPPEATSDEAGAPSRDEDYLILSTIHSAKGQEWDAVYVLNAVDGCLPSDLATGSAADIEEERRLLYVAMTRARQTLALVAPLRFHVTQQAAFGDRHLYASLTRFIPPQVADAWFERIGAACAAPEPSTRGMPGPLVDVAAQVRSLWR
jgi:DNA helicase-2/ATP-dependent DNA helicase PcrA